MSRSRLNRFNNWLRGVPLLIRLRPSGARVAGLVGSRLAAELRQAIEAWEPVNLDASLRIADAARRLAARGRREFSDASEFPPLNWELHAEVDALLLTLDDLDRAMRAAAADSEDVGILCRAAVAMVSTGSSLDRLAFLILARSGLVPADRDNDR